jgi:outer membrane protein assembly factor BamA
MFAYATEPSSYRLEFFGEFFKLIDDWRIETRIGKNELAYNRFYGFGNELKLTDGIDSDFYRVSQEFIYFDYMMEHHISKNSVVQFSTGINRSYLLKDDETVLGTDEFKGTGRNHYISIGGGWNYDSRDDQNFTGSGFYVSLNGKYVPAIWDNKADYSKTNFDSRFYFTPPLLPVTLAGRIYAEYVWGSYYIFDAAKLGGSDNLLGFSRERFSGDAAVMGQLEARFPLAKLRIIIPGVLGLSTHAGSGRVFYDGKDDKTKKWHGYYGGGVWVSYLKNSIILNCTASQSVEGTQIYLTTGFLF